jgi:hypothetical protein
MLMQAMVAAAMAQHMIHTGNFFWLIIVRMLFDGGIGVTAKSAAEYEVSGKGSMSCEGEAAVRRGRLDIELDGSVRNGSG